LKVNKIFQRKFSAQSGELTSEVTTILENMIFTEKAIYQQHPADMSLKVL
jgi:hypothetical protein